MSNKLNTKNKFKETKFGLIPDDWRILKLGYLCHIKYGKGLPERERKIGNYPVYGSNGIVYWHERPFVPGPGIIVGRKGSIGTVEFTEKDFWPIDTAFFIEPPKQGGIDLKFLYYQLKAANLKSLGGTDSAVPGLNRDALASYELFIPPVEEQQKIAEVLGALDEKIELNRKMNKTLESLAQAIFKKWFIDDADPNWETKKLGNVVRIRYGKNLPTTKLQVSGHPVFGGNGQIGFFDKYIYESPQVLVACRGAASGKVNFSLPKSFVTNNSLVLEYDNCLNYEFLKYFALNADFHSCVSGSAQPQITIESLDGYEIIMPDKGIINKFGQVVAPITQKILLNNNEISNLSQIRDSLLPRLMSGKLRVK